jgi:hypothetical protein
MIVTFFTTQYCSFGFVRSQGSKNSSAFETSSRTQRNPIACENEVEKPNGVMEEDSVEEKGITDEIANEILDATKRETKLKYARSKLTSRSLNYIINTLSYTPKYANELSGSYYLMNTIILETAYSTAVANWFSAFFIELLRKPITSKENPLDNAYFKHEGSTIKLDILKKLEELAIDGEINTALQNSSPFLSFL